MAVRLNRRLAVSLFVLAALAIAVASTGEPYPLEIVKRGSETGHIAFTDWRQPVSLAAPSGAIDLSQLQHAGH